ncbi:MAG: biotin--[acetyl-CoA-carboxylase] ligase [Proteobacteria bacterium]|nr:biotin--[acetyl-CoA-carboxylase] ligase [Pseudomonadota bacterium]MDA1063812.1 biotin--[acetyl-CoA-carboxylase] ligase [Pseudomonadota bacterium]
MRKLDAKLIRSLLSAGPKAGLDQIEWFASIASTNTYLLGQPPPPAGRCRIAIADHQTAGRGRHFRRWVSPPGSGLCLSFAYTFSEAPRQMPSLTLAIGVGITTVLKGLGAAGVGLKWPNDIVALDGKMGGILTEVHGSRDGGVTVVTGIGLNVSLPTGAADEIESDWARLPVDLKSVVDTVPAPEVIVVAIVEGLCGAMHKFATLGFSGFAADWAEHDWLRDREVTVDLPDRQITGVAAGVDTDGALLIDTGKEITRVISGSIVMAGSRRAG